MFTVAWETLQSGRGQILGWGLALFLLGLIVVPAYDLVAENMEQFSELMDAYPPEIMAFFGDIQSIGTPEGFLHVEFFSYMPLVIGTFAILFGSGLLASDEESGRLDLIAAYPISRLSLFGGRLLGFLAITFVICLLGWLAFVISLNWSTMDVPLLDLALPFVSLYALTFLFGGLAVALSEILPARRMAASLSGLVLVASFFITSFSRINPDLERPADFSPITYYQGGEAISGLNWGWIAGLLATSALFVMLAGFSFQRRDIRVAGERSWRIRSLIGRSHEAAEG